MFLAGDGAALIGDDALNSVEGKGSLGAHFAALNEGGARFFVSGIGKSARFSALPILGGSLSKVVSLIMVDNRLPITIQKLP